MMEVTLKELQQMLLEDKISTEQFVSIMIQNFGKEVVMETMEKTVQEVYGKKEIDK
jgi:hypothetical protein